MGLQKFIWACERYFFESGFVTELCPFTHRLPLDLNFFRNFAIVTSNFWHKKMDNGIFYEQN